METLEVLASNIPFNLSKPAQILTKMPKAIADKFIFGVKVGIGGISIFSAVVIIILILATVLSMVGVNLSSLTQRSRAAIGL